MSRTHPNDEGTETYRTGGSRSDTYRSETYISGGSNGSTSSDHVPPPQFFTDIRCEPITDYDDEYGSVVEHPRHYPSHRPIPLLPHPPPTLVPGYSGRLAKVRHSFRQSYPTRPFQFSTLRALPSLSLLNPTRRSSPCHPQLGRCHSPFLTSVVVFCRKKVRREYDTVEPGVFPRDTRAQKDRYDGRGNRFGRSKSRSWRTVKGVAGDQRRIFERG
jgi:hypothetical protein